MRLPFHVMRQRTTVAPPSELTLNKKINPRISALGLCTLEYTITYKYINKIYTSFH